MYLLCFKFSISLPNHLAMFFLYLIHYKKLWFGMENLGPWGCTIAISFSPINHKFELMGRRASVHILRHTSRPATLLVFIYKHQTFHSDDFCCLTSLTIDFPFHLLHISFSIPSSPHKHKSVFRGLADHWSRLPCCIVFLIFTTGGGKQKSERYSHSLIQFRGSAQFGKAL